LVAHKEDLTQADHNLWLVCTLWLLNLCKNSFD